MITISALMAQGLYPKVKSYLIIGKEHGLTKIVVEMVTHMINWNLDIHHKSEMIKEIVKLRDKYYL